MTDVVKNSRFGSGLDAGAGLISSAEERLSAAWRRMETMGSCCCGVFSLRQGNFLLGVYLFLCGLAELLAQRKVGFLVLTAGLAGMLSSYTRNEKLARCHTGALLTVFAVKVCLFLFVDTHALTEELIDEECRNADNQFACRRYLQIMMKQNMHSSKLVAFGVLVFIYGWSAAVAYSYQQVLEVGGRGDEKLNADALGRSSEKQQLLDV